MKLHESTMWKEINEQKAAIENARKVNLSLLEKIANEAEARKIQSIVFVARGSSEHAAQAAKYIFETHAGIITTFAAPSITTHYQGLVDYSNSLVIGISQSGAAQDVYEVMKAAEKQGALVVSLTNGIDSLMSSVGKYKLHLACGPEVSVTATKSYMTQLVLLALLAAYMSDDEVLFETLHQIPEIIEMALLYKEQVSVIVAYFRNVDRINIFGRGLLYALSMESELKIQETSMIDARAYASSDYRHGPIATVNRYIPSIFYIADKETNSCIIDLFHVLKNEKQVTTFVITNKKEIAEQSDFSIVFREEIDGLKALIASAVITQMFACLLSLARGLDPDQPDGIAKVTITR